MLTEAETLVDRYQYLNQRLENVRDQVDEQITNNVAEINSIGQAIADINKQIVLSAGSGAPSDLLDSRDQLLKELSEYIAVDSYVQDNGALNVFMGKGQILVVNFDARTITTTPNQYDISQTEVGLQIGGGVITNISNQITGGKVGALLDFRSQILDVTQNELGELAIGMAETFNAQHMLGMDLSNNLGQAFFNSPSLEVLEGGATVPANVVANLVDSNNLTADDYLLSAVDGVNSYTLTNQATGQVTAINTGGASPYTAPEVDGFNLTITAGAAAGDTYLIRPTRLGAKELSTLITNPQELAVAVPVRTEKSLTNTGTAEISAGVVTSIANLPLPADVTLTYNAAGTEFVVAGAVPAVANIPYVSGNTISFNGLEIAISGVPADTDVFTISNNSSGVGDNRNALLLSGLQTTRNLSGSNASYQEFYGGMVADVGIKTRQAQITERSQQTLLSQAENARDSLSGVNLDEEAANLIKYQQAYQAMGQVIASANAMFNELLSVLRR
jgi:flagellar hook-associated protein 1 FlgK